MAGGVDSSEQRWLGGTEIRKINTSAECLRTGVGRGPTESSPEVGQKQAGWAGPLGGAAAWPGMMRHLKSD